MNETSTAADAPLSSPGPGSPAVRLVELAERAAARLMRRGLLPGQDSVRWTCVTWPAPSPRSSTGA
jgi:hypothetical protein